jgi:hypothetical protein
METPFPGMDPYLEHPALSPGFQNRLIVALANQVQPLLDPRYIATIEQRAYIEGRGTGGLEINEWTIHIVDRYCDMKVVTVIEVVSPANKVPGAGRRSYRTKQREVRASECHLVEVDLLRRGRHVLCVPEAHARELADYDYLTCVSRWPKRRRFELYRTRLRERLPRVGLPLSDPDADVLLDVQAGLEQVYWEGRFMLRLRYEEPCDPPLDAADQQWADERGAAYRAAHPELFPPPAAS